MRLVVSRVGWLMVLVALAGTAGCYSMARRPVHVTGFGDAEACVGTVARVFERSGFVRVDGIAGGVVLYTPIVSINTRSFASGLRWGVGVHYQGDPFAGKGCDFDLEPLSYDQECPSEHHVICKLSFQPGDEFAAATEELGRRMRLAFARAPE